MEYLTKIYMILWGNRKVILTFPTIIGGDSTMEKSNGKYRESNKNPLRIDL
jgi:hypothetical protein